MPKPRSKPSDILKYTLIRLGTFAALVLLFPILSERSRFISYRVMGLAYTARNRKKFKRLGEAVFLSGDLVFRGPERIAIGAGTSVGKGCSIAVWDAGGTGRREVFLEIGEHTSIGEGAHITAANAIKIGNHVLLGKYVTISDNNHGGNTLQEIDIPPALRQLASKGPVVIGDNVWIGDKATILAGVTVGRGAVIAANSVVTKDVPEACVVAGIPAKVVKTIE